MTTVLNSPNAESFFTALDNADLHEINECLNKFPEYFDKKDKDLRVPLHYAADCADFPTFQRILDLNPALIDAQDNAGFTPLFVAVMAGNIDALNLLNNRGAQLTHVDFDKHSVVHWAVVCAQLKSLDYLLKYGAPFETADIHGAYPLHYATVIENVSIERAETILYVLLKQGCNVNCTDNDGRTPLIWAASSGNIEGFKSLIQAGANKFISDHDRLGVLHCAAYHGHSEIVRIFLNHGPKNESAIDAKDINGDTPLFYACTYGHYDCAKILLEKGADANHMDKRCRCAAHCAATKGQLRILNLLKQYGASFELQNYRGDLPFHEAVQTGSLNMVEWLLQLEPNFLSARNFCGRTPLHLAAASGNMELTVLLCTRGAKINSLMLYKNELYTPLDLAKRRQHDLIVEYLSQRHEALTAENISIENQNEFRTNIEEELKTAKLRRVRAQFLSSDSEGEQSSYYGKKYKTLRREKSMHANILHRKLDGNHRKSKSALDLYSKRFPKLCNTINLSETEINSQNDLKNESGNTTNITESLVKKKSNNIVGIERYLVESTIQKIVQDELRKAAAKTPDDYDIKPKKIKEHKPKYTAQGSLDSILAQTTTNENQKNKADTQKHVKLAHLSPKRSSPTMLVKEKKCKNKHFSSLPQNLGLNLQEYDSLSLEQNRRVKKNFVNSDSKQKFYGEQKNDKILNTKLNLIQDNYYLNKNARLLISEESRYVHEKAIFEELSHLKQMQIQYGKVQERILVRSLIFNFCKMHGLNPSHFRYQKFCEWEKFLYDQLKMIYLEERDRIQMIASNLNQSCPNFYARSNASQQSFSRYANYNSSVLIQSKKLENKLRKVLPLDEQLRELTRIYGNATISNVIPKHHRNNLRKKLDVKNDILKNNKFVDENLNLSIGSKQCKCLSRQLQS